MFTRTRRQKHFCDQSKSVAFHIALIRHHYITEA